MRAVILDEKVKETLKEAFGKIDDELRELEEIHEEMDVMLYDIERRIARLRRSKRA